MRKFLFWSAVTLLALFISALTFVYLRSSFPDQIQSQIEADSAQTIVVAAKDISLRRTITESDLAVREVTLDAIPEGAATSIDDVVGMMVTTNVFSGETILAQQLAITGEILQQISLTIPDNKVLIPIPLQSHLLDIGLVKPGDRVDLIGTFVADEVVREHLEDASSALESVQTAHQTIAVLQNLEVHAIIIEPSVAAINSEAEDGVFVTQLDGEQSILVSLENQDSVVVKYLLDTTGLLDIALRASGDEQLVDVTNVDLFYLADRYGIELVRGDPVVMSQEMFDANPNEFIFTGTEPSPEFLDAIGEK